MKSLFGFALSLCLLACVSFADGLSDLEACLRTLQTSDVTFEALGRTFKLRTNAPNAQIAGSVTKSCAAGLLYVNRQDFYNARIRPGIPDAQEFEQTLRTPCAKCDGQGKVSSACSQCGGSGKCKSFNCHDGQAEFKGLNGRVDYRPCPACKGTGNCPKCNGTGTVAVSCALCMGRGGGYSSGQALKTCRDYAQGSLDAINAIRQNHPLPAAQGDSQAANLKPSGNPADKEFADDTLLTQTAQSNDLNGGEALEHEQDASGEYAGKQSADDAPLMQAAQENDLNGGKGLEHEQDAGGGILVAKWGVTLKEIEKVRNYSRYTSMQRSTAFNALWDRALVLDQRPNARHLFIKFPDGMKYKVRDVSDSSGVGLPSMVIMLEPADDASEQNIRDAEKNINEMASFSIGLVYPRLIALLDDTQMRNLNRGDEVRSDGWTLAVVISDQRLQPDFVFRQESVYLTISPLLRNLR